MFKLFKKNKPAERVPVFGISSHDYCEIINKLDAEYQKARSRQKSPESEPNRYMQGLLFALDVLESVEIHEVGVAR